MMTISEYAESRQISQTAVRRQLSRYGKELSNHVTLKGRTKYLDAEAVDFLDQHRLSRTVVQEYAEGQAKQEIDKLKAEIALLQQKYLESQEHIIKLLEENKELIKYQSENQYLLEQRDRDREELTAAKAEIDSFTKTWFGFYRKTKS